jgi:hypothetical protein
MILLLRARSLASERGGGVQNLISMVFATSALCAGAFHLHCSCILHPEVHVILLLLYSAYVCTRRRRAPGARCSALLDLILMQPTSRTQGPPPRPRRPTNQVHSSLHVKEILMSYVCALFSSRCPPLALIGPGNFLFVRRSKANRPVSFPLE